MKNIYQLLVWLLKSTLSFLSFLFELFWFMATRTLACALIFGAVSGILLLYGDVQNIFNIGGWFLGIITVMVIGGYLINDTPAHAQEENFFETLRDTVVPIPLFIIVEWVTYQLCTGTFNSKIIQIVIQQITVMSMVWVAIIIVGFSMTFILQIWRNWCEEQIA